MVKEDRERFRREMDAYNTKKVELPPVEVYEFSLPQTDTAVPNLF